MRANRSGACAVVAGLLLLAGARATEAQTSTAAPPETGPRSVHTGDFTLEAGETADDVVVVGGDLRVLGTITGDAVVVGGELILEQSGSIEGDATVTGGSIVENGGRVAGEMRMLDAAGGDIQAAVERAVNEGTAPAVAVQRGADRNDRDDDRWDERRNGGSSWFRSIRNGFFGLISTFAFALVLAGIGAVLTFYGRSYLDTVSDTIRGATVRSGAVGLAASFLVIPAFVVLIVALAVSIIGIPFLLVAVPLYPLAVAAAAGMGLLAAAHAIGERTSEQRSHQAFDYRYRNSYAYLFSGLAMLIAPLLAAHLIEMTGFLSFIGILLKVVTWIVIWAATTVGFGAVILSRGGTQRTFVPRPPDAGFDPDPAFDTEPYASGPHV